MKIKQLSPQLLVTDLERSLDFYRQHLGFKIDFLYEDFYAGISNDGHSLHFKSGQPKPAGGDDLDLVFSVEEITSLFEAFKKLPVIITQELREMPYGWEFYIADPDGYILSFMENE